VNPVNVKSSWTLTKVLAEGKGEIVRDRPKEALKKINLSPFSFFFLGPLFPCPLFPFSIDDLLDVILERYRQRKSSLITSNRPIEDWGKLLGDNAAASAILDRLLHRGHLLKFEGKSYRLKEASKRLALEKKKN
jgi:hypothetical protein